MSKSEATIRAALPKPSARRTRVRAFIAYWWQCTKEAAQGASAFANDWQWLFGIPVVTGVAGYLAARQGRGAITTGHPIVDGVLTALAAFVVTWFVAFLVQLFNAPVIRDYKQRSEISRLKGLAGEARSESFEVVICAVHEHDADRVQYDIEDLFRIAITNLEREKTLHAYAVLEGLPSELGISPAARLPAMGKGIDAQQFSIAASETVYLRFVERHLKDSFLAELREDRPWVTFTVDASGNQSQRVMAGMLRDADKIGELITGKTYSGVIAVHAAGAVSRRLPFSIHVADDGVVTATT